MSPAAKCGTLPHEAAPAIGLRCRPALGNYPVCRLAVRGVGKGKTPRHGQIKWRRGYWLPPCPGSGQPLLWLQWL
ncbi:MAG: hypothetical protein AAB433_02660 [Nitrospirota bacterium]